MRLLAIIGFTILFLAVFSAPWRLGISPLYKGLTAVLGLVLDIVIFLLLIALAYWLAVMLVNWIGIA